MRNLLLVLALALLTWWVLSRPHGSLPPRVGGVRVAVANLLGSNSSPDAASAALAALDVDLLVLTEWTGTNLDGGPIRTAGWQILVNTPEPGMGLMLLSRGDRGAEAARVTLPPMGQWSIPMGVARVPLGAGHLAVLGLHVPPPVPPYQPFNAPTIAALMDWVADGRLVRDLGPGRRGDPVLAVGDFNAVSWSDALQPVADAGLRDAWDATQWRPGPTWGPWPGVPSLARIDYAFVGADLPLLGSWTLNLPGSDHRVVVAEVGPPAPGPR